MSAPPASQQFPDGIDERNLRPLVRWPNMTWLPVAILGTLLVVALFGVFGGGPSPTVTAEAPAGRLSVTMPHTMRSGLFFEVQIEAEAKRDFEDLVIAFPPSLFHQMTINTMIPAPSEEEFKDGRFRWSYGPMQAGDRLVLKVDGQINPPLTLGTEGDVALFDGDRLVTHVPLSIKVFP